MKGMAAIVMILIVFVAGALYGIDKNNEKAHEQPDMVVTEQDASNEDSKITKEDKDHPKEDSICAPPPMESNGPWVTKLAEGLGNGVASGFNGVIVVLSEIIQAGS
ncbi:hypothetical protein SAMN05192559_102204 [Halobacillus karajensis]|uniref:Uncharacterized protein n=1 Tax=Halobacillus karajensis TaxID=195088 RepID=A0A024P696_9BACI|nr:hypothetical protein [Halobacillus karajensis]CDQ18055.1 hypothetical protein BN982_00301 [Halobacillus karajensis]CDQ24405.1 hypothetical protein BN983_02685 [Halobacillus karajensis]CDQ29347.1 hypothetical protein BN981_03722 [Halobacillus karajensis]SEH60177.1 hypothetical protein SAMN05192559_102204 [Halobacillus karajensis]